MNLVALSVPKTGIDLKLCVVSKFQVKKWRWLLTVLLPIVVCGFEAFINGKHIVGEVKEKEQAHKEYREAISQGHGAYLMDEETPVSHVALYLSRDLVCAIS